MLTVVKIESTGANQLLVTVAAPTQDEARGPAAREAARQAAVPYLGRCGFSSFADMSYLPEGKDPAVDPPLTEAEMVVPGAIQPGKGLWLAACKIQGCL